MKSLKELLEMSGTSFKTVPTEKDPETGKLSWDVEYYPDFSGILDNMNVLINDLNAAIKKHSIKDKDILMNLKALRTTKSTLLKTLETKYPEYIKNYFAS